MLPSFLSETWKIGLFIVHKDQSVGARVVQATVPVPASCGTRASLFCAVCDRRRLWITSTRCVSVRRCDIAASTERADATVHRHSNELQSYFTSIQSKNLQLDAIRSAHDVSALGSCPSRHMSGRTDNAYSYSRRHASRGCSPTWRCPASTTPIEQA